MFKKITRDEAIRLIANEYDKLTHARLLQIVKDAEVEALEEYSDAELALAVYGITHTKVVVSNSKGEN